MNQRILICELMWLFITNEPREVTQLLRILFFSSIKLGNGSLEAVAQRLKSNVILGKV